MSFFACREKPPTDNSNSMLELALRFAPGDYFSYGNWNLDFYGRRIAASRFKNSWTVVDTGRAIRGWTRVAVLVDSTFNSNNQLIRQDSIFFRVGDDGDLYQYGFLKSLIAERETLNLAPQWDRIAAYSLPAGQSWVITRIDSSLGARTNEVVYGRIFVDKEYVGPIVINGVERAILSYKIEITKPRLNYTFWLTESPTSITVTEDDSETLANATLRELKFMRTRQ